MAAPKILYEDEDVLVINKPAGIMVHGDGRTKDKTISDWILKTRPEMKEIGEPARFHEKDGSIKIINRPGIVHRLDKDTTGVLIIAKNTHAYRFLKKQFRERSIKKTYIAVVHGSVKNERGVIDRPIGRSSADFRKRSASRGAKGDLRQAVTTYKTVGHIEKKVGEEIKKYSLLELFPKTGRTHQIRVHLKAIGHPIVCDNLYAGKLGGGLSFDRPALHARDISFLLPSGKNITVEAPVPTDFEGAIKSVA